MPALIASIAIGVWLLAAPDLLGITGAARLSHLVVGPVVASLATIALWPVARPLVRINVPLGLWLVVAPALFDHQGWGAESVIAGGLLVFLALVPRSQAHRFGGGWASLLGSPDDRGRR